VPLGPKASDLLPLREVPTRVNFVRGGHSMRAKTAVPLVAANATTRPNPDHPAVHNDGFSLASLTAFLVLAFALSWAWLLPLAVSGLPASLGFSASSPSPFW